jgi:hypothetical protein
MNDVQRKALLEEAVIELKRTDVGYPPKLVAGTHWARAMAKLSKLEDDLEPDPLPDLGSVVRGGTSVLNVKLTHNTDGIPLYPAWDDGWVAGREVIAPEQLRIVAPLTSSNPGMAFYARGTSKIGYWFGHLDRHHKVGTNFVRGQVIGKIAWQPNNKSHVHIGINIELLVGRGSALKYGSNGNGPDYTPYHLTVGQQLRTLLSV